MPQVKTSTPKVERIGNYVREKNRSLFGSGYRWYDVNLPVGRHYVFLDKEARVGDWILKPDGTKVSVNARGLAPSTTSTPKPKVNSTSNQSNKNRTSNQSNGTNSGVQPKAAVQPNSEQSKGSRIASGTAQQPKVTVNSRSQANTGNRRRSSSRGQQRVNVGGGYQDKAYTPGVGVNPEMIVASPPQGVAIPLSQELVSPTPNIPETIEVPQVSTPGTFTRRDVRNMLRAKGINPYYEIGGLQRRALRRYLNGEPVAGEYQDFINKIMQQ